MLVEDVFFLQSLHLMRELRSNLNYIGIANYKFEK